jgi:GT2 family glycosyltransferase
VIDLSIVVVSWNTRELLAQCLDSVVQSQGVGEMELLVVDNASADGSVQMVRERFPQARLLVNKENVGFARANNQAIRQANGRYVLLLNPDTRLLPDALAQLVCFMESEPGAGAAGARLLNPDGSLQPSCSPAPTLSREWWYLFHLDRLRPYSRYPMRHWDVQSVREVDVVQGAAMILRRDVLAQIGLMDEGYFMYSEEVDLCDRVREAGWRIYWVPQAQVVHYGGQSTRQAAREMFLRLYEGKLLYFRKRHGRSAARLYKLVLLAAALVRLTLTPLAWLGRSPNRQQYLTLAGYYRQLVLDLPNW